MTDLDPAAGALEVADFSLLDQPAQQRCRYFGAAAVLVHDKDHGFPPWRLAGDFRSPVKQDPATLQYPGRQIKMALRGSANSFSFSDYEFGPSEDKIFHLPLIDADSRR
jgi:hypothetical protein